MSSGHVEGERFRWRANPEAAAHLADGVKCLELDSFEFTMDNIPTHAVEGCQCVIEPIAE